MDTNQQIAVIANQIRELTRQVDDLQRISFRPENLEAIRTSIGIGYIGADPTTVPTGSIIVNSKEGPIKILRA